MQWQTSPQTEQGMESGVENTETRAGIYALEQPFRARGIPILPEGCGRAKVTFVPLIQASARVRFR